MRECEHSPPKLCNIIPTCALAAVVYVISLDIKRYLVHQLQAGAQQSVCNKKRHSHDDRYLTRRPSIDHPETTQRPHGDHLENTRQEPARADKSRHFYNIPVANGQVRAGKSRHFSKYQLTSNYAGKPCVGLPVENGPLPAGKSRQEPACTCHTSCENSNNSRRDD